MGILAHRWATEDAEKARQECLVHLTRPIEAICPGADLQDEVLRYLLTTETILAIPASQFASFSSTH